MPLVLLLDGAGERAPNASIAGARAPERPPGPRRRISGPVPTVAWSWARPRATAPSAAPLIDYVVMVEGASLFTAGPPRWPGPRARR